jgi:sulfonate transport system substrate-binding protein
MVMDRRLFLALAAGCSAANLVFFKATAQTKDAKEIRIGYQKSGIFPAVKQRKTLESVFNPQGIEI